MTNTITSALGSSIGFIQLKLYDFDQGEIDFEKILNERFQSVDAPQNINHTNLTLLH